MNLICSHIGRSLLICFFTSGLYAQDSTIKYSIDTSQFSMLSTISLGRYQVSFNYIYHSPEKKDQQCYQAYKYLEEQQPTIKNHKLYFDLACSLWELEKIADAEKMFLTIVNSKEKF